MLLHRGSLLAAVPGDDIRSRLGGRTGGPDQTLIPLVYHCNRLTAIRAEPTE